MIVLHRKEAQVSFQHSFSFPGGQRCPLSLSLSLSPASEFFQLPSLSKRVEREEEERITAEKTGCRIDAFQCKEGGCLADGSIAVAKRT